MREEFSSLDKKYMMQAAMDLYGKKVAKEIKKCKTIGEAQRILINERHSLEDWR